MPYDNATVNIAGKSFLSREAAFLHSFNLQQNIARTESWQRQINITSDMKKHAFSLYT